MDSVEVICEEYDDLYLCIIGGKLYRFKEIEINGNMPREKEFTIDAKDIEINGDNLRIIMESPEENFDEIKFLREYYRKEIPTSEDMKKKKEIWQKYKTLSDKQDLLLKIAGGRPETADICLYDTLPKKVFSKNGFKELLDDKEKVVEFVKNTRGKNNKHIRVLVEPTEDGDYLVRYIRVYEDNDIHSPVCILEDNRWLDVVGGVHE